MKKWILPILTAVILLCSCSARSNDKEQMPAELKLIKNHFSAIYRIKTANKNGEVLPDEELEEKAIQASAGFSLSFDNVENTLKNFDKSYYYLKECLKSMENIRLTLSEDGVDSELINGLDSTVNRLAHQLNQKNDTETMRAINDGIYIIGAISEHYAGSKRACILRLEYCLNLLEIESESKAELDFAIDLTKSVLKEVGESTDIPYKELEQMQKSIESISKATVYSDGRLIRMKVGVLRDNLNKIFKSR